MRIVDYNACSLDSPDLRSALLDQERVLDDYVKSMKRVIESFNRVRETGQSHSEALLGFSRAIRELGTGGTDEPDSRRPSGNIGALKAERDMANFFVQLSHDLEYIEEARRRWLQNSQRLFMDELNSQRAKIKEFLSETRREYYEETRKFYHSQERSLARSTPPTQDMDNERLDYLGRTYEYVKALQFRQAKNKSRFFEIIATLQSVWKCFYQECNDNLGEREHFMNAMNESVMRFNNSVDLAEQELEEHKRHLLLSSSKRAASSRINGNMMEGYLLMAQRKLGIPTSWQRCYCTLTLDNRVLNLMPYSPANPGSSSGNAILGNVSSVTEDSSGGRRFSFEVSTIEGRSLLLQAYSSLDSQDWIRALAGQRPLTSEEALRPTQAEVDRLVSCIRELESRGLEEEGLYRVEGQSSQVEELLQGYILDGRGELKPFGIRVLSSGIKRYLKNLPQPLITFDFVQYLNDTSGPAGDTQQRPLPELRDRLSADRLPVLNRRLIVELVGHLRRVADCSVSNKMTPENLALVFALTVCWPREYNLQSVQYCTVEGKQLVLTLLQHAEDILPDAFPASSVASASSRAPVLRQASGDDIIESRVLAAVPKLAFPSSSGSSSSSSKLHRLDQMSFNLHGPKRCARTLYACKADTESELSFEANEIVYDVQKIDGNEGWCCGVIKGRRGIIPLNYIELLQ